MKKYTNVCVKIIVLEETDIVRTSDGVGEDFVTGIPGGDNQLPVLPWTGSGM